jgi:hypothetical protein
MASRQARGLAIIQSVISCRPENRPVWHEVSKGVVKRLQATCGGLKALRPFQGWPPAGCRVVGHGGP